MEFEGIDNVTGDALTTGDIILEDGAYHQLLSLEDDEQDLITFSTYNLSTGDHDDVALDPFDGYVIYRCY
jgi:hypothetical protein